MEKKKCKNREKKTWVFEEIFDVFFRKLKLTCDKM